MKNHIVFFSGGKSSFSVADWVTTNFPDDNIVLYFTDTQWENHDLYRFIYQAADKLKLPMLTHSAGINPVELMVEKKLVFNSRLGDWSKVLKMKVSRDYLKKGIVPPIEKWRNKKYLKHENFIEDATLYFGIGFEEMHREGPIRKNWKPFDVQMPLIDNEINNDEVLKKHNIRQPELYNLGFTHNNCNGRCVKAGQAHFKNLKEKMPDVFQELMEQEIVISDYVRYSRQPQIKDGKQKNHLEKDVSEFIKTGKKSQKIKHIIETNKHTKRFNLGGRSMPYSFMKKRNDGESKPYLIEELNEDMVKDGSQLDLFDFGGCGCFVQYE
ncbi:phosphoadenosine phosphosulfate reductase family protein [Alkalihalobacillus sp. FSL R5-0424]